MSDPDDLPNIPTPVMGMRCHRCHIKIAGGLMLQLHNMTDEIGAAILRRLKIYPVCEFCIQNDASYVETANAEQLK